MKLTFRPEARADLAGIALYIGRDNVMSSRAFVARLRERCDILKAHPLAGRPRPEFGEGVRSIVEGAYVILYRADPNEVVIVAVLHGARDLPALLAKRLKP